MVRFDHYWYERKRELVGIISWKYSLFITGALLLGVWRVEHKHELYARINLFIGQSG